jgi:predicted GNAT family N-acyltransferase
MAAIRHRHFRSNVSGRATRFIQMESSVPRLELVELGPLTEHGWEDLRAGERDPFGAVGARLTWRPKDRHMALRAPDGRLVAAAGALVADVEVGGSERFQVVGVGSVIVTRSLRGGGLVSKVVDPLLRLAERMGPDRAMLFCRPELVSLYRRFGFGEIAAPVWADQPDGRIEMPMAAMWRRLRLRVGPWPPGRVDVLGLPF